MRPRRHAELPMAVTGSGLRELRDHRRTNSIAGAWGRRGAEMSPPGQVSPGNNPQVRRAIAASLTAYIGFDLRIQPPPERRIGTRSR